MANPTEKKPSIGRIVMYVPVENSKESNNGATIVPAIVVRTWEEGTNYVNNECNIRVFNDGPDSTWLTSVPHSSDKEAGTWHWPEIN